MASFKLEEATEWKNKDENAFSGGELKRVATCHSLGIAASDGLAGRDGIHVKATSLSNRAMCHLKQQNHEKALEDCAAGSELDQSHMESKLRVKMFFRRAKACLALPKDDDKNLLQMAESDLLLLLKEDATNLEAQKMLEKIRSQQPTIGALGKSRQWQCNFHHPESHFDSCSECAKHKEECNRERAEESVQQETKIAATEEAAGKLPDRHLTPDFDSSDDDEENEIRNCRKCNETPEQVSGQMSFCTACKSVSHCGKECQVADSSVHKKSCTFLVSFTGHPLHAGEMEVSDGSQLGFISLLSEGS